MTEIGTVCARLIGSVRGGLSLPAAPKCTRLSGVRGKYTGKPPGCADLYAMVRNPDMTPSGAPFREDSAFAPPRLHHTGVLKPVKMAIRSRTILKIGQPIGTPRPGECKTSSRSKQSGGMIKLAATSDAKIIKVQRRQCKIDET
jgi:hypothetical protein